VVLAAAELHRQVHPPADRDWSAMITLFLNGGIGEHSFHPSLATYVQQALKLIPKPVPALPNGDFVHGDFSFANMLFDHDRLKAVVDTEAFGTGTVAVDLLRLLPELPLAECRAVIDRATELTSPDVVTACLCHRILAGLDWASQHPHLLDRAARQARRLLTLRP
jgi:Ser/Thr protein kinase RdoA (MazF antagonist)